MIAALCFSMKQEVCNNTALTTVSDGKNCRYIPLPPELYSLRHKVPSSLHYLLLECQRCFQWIPVEVTSYIPEVLPCSALEVRDEQWIVSRRERNNTGVKDEGGEEERCWRSPRLREHHGSHHLPVSSSSLSHGRRASGGVPPEAAQQQHHVAQKDNKDGSEVPSLYIPNPQCFVCNGLMCEKGDRLLALRSEWLRTLYASCLKEENYRGGDLPPFHTGDPPVTLHSEEGRQHLAKMLKTSLSEELDIRRSERLAGRKRQQEDSVYHHHHHQQVGESFAGHAWEEREDGMETFKIESENGKWAPTAEVVLSSTSPSSSPLHVDTGVVANSAFVRQMVKQAFQEDTALSSSFCWVMCERCGKMRRTAQPFPGGSPFVCALSVAKSCRVSQIEGLRLYNQKYSDRMLERISLLSSGPGVHFPFQLEDDDSSSATPTARREAKSSREVLGETQKARAHHSLFSSSQNEPLLRWIIGYSQTLSSSPSSSSAKKGNRAQKSSHSLSPEEEMYFPSLKVLTTAIRKKSMSTFVKKMVLDPKEIRKKRERIGCSMFLEGTTTISSSSEPPVSPPPPQQELSVSLTHSGSSASQKVKGIDHGKNEKHSSPFVEERKKNVENKHESATGQLSHHHSQPPSSLKHAKEEQHCGSNRVALSSFTSSSREEKPLSQKRKRNGVRNPEPTVKEDEKWPSNGEGISKKGRRKKLNEEVIYWIQCDKCDKWRIVPRSIKPDKWECSMRLNTTCEDTDDAAKDEDG